MTILKPLQNKVILITGASRGIGRATALLFAKLGSDLILLARDIDRLHQLRDEIKSLYDVDILIFQADVRNIIEIDTSIKNSIDHFNKIDIAICNAGIGQYGPVNETNWKDIIEIFRVNTEGAIATAHLILPKMIEQKSGSIIFISSVLGKRAVQYNAAYSASKYALHGFADAFRLEVKRYGIHVGVVCPARTDTEFFDRMIYSIPQTRQRKVPISSPEKVASAILIAVIKRKREVVVSLGGKMYAFVGVHFPRIFDVILEHAVPIPKKSK